MMMSPLPYGDQGDEIKSQFDLILSAILSINGNSSEEEIRALNDRIQREVTVKPILARIVQDDDSIIDACAMLNNKLVHPAIKCLINANPSALLWETDSDNGERVIYDVANHPSHCVLLLWIAINHQWVLDHDICLECPPVFDLLHQYANRGETSKCTAAIIRQFFEAYPHGLTQEDEDGSTPLHAIVDGSAECEPDLFMWMAEQCPRNVLKADSQGYTPLQCNVDLFKWMAEKCPSNVIQTDRSGETPLHRACYSLARHLGDDSSEICKYLIEQCPESVRKSNDDGWLPIHYLHYHCQHQTVKEVVVCLLREYPESYDMAAQTYDGNPIPAPSTVPFIQRVKLLLDEERELKENVAYLQDVAGVFCDAVDGTQTPNSLASSTSEAFGNWVMSSIRDLEAKIEQIETQLQHECNVD